MKVLNRVGGFFLLLILGVAVISGFQSPTGRPLWDSMWDAVRSILLWTQARVRSLNGNFVDGNGRAAIGWAATGLVVTLVLLKKPISIRVFSFLVVAAAAVAFVLWQPSAIS
jgi:hypothetical protein